MNLENQPLLKGQTVYALIDGVWKSCEVCDVNEQMKAAKVTYVKDLKKSRFKSEWFSVKDLSRTI